MGFIDLSIFGLGCLYDPPRSAPRGAEASTPSCSSGSESGTAEASPGRPDTTWRSQEPCTVAVQDGEPSQRLTAVSILSR